MPPRETCWERRAISAAEDWAAASISRPAGAGEGGVAQDAAPFGPGTRGSGRWLRRKRPAGGCQSRRRWKEVGEGFRGDAGGFCRRVLDAGGARRLWPAARRGYPGKAGKRRQRGEFRLRRQRQFPSMISSWSRAAMASIRPEPQTPAGAASSMVCTCSAPFSAETWSMAPRTLPQPQEMPAPSKAGPGGRGGDVENAVLPEGDFAVGADVAQQGRAFFQALARGQHGAGDVRAYEGVHAGGQQGAPAQQRRFPGRRGNPPQRERGTKIPDYGR